MKWKLKFASRGDIVRVPIGPVFHYGIFVDESRVIQFGLPPRNGFGDSDNIEVCTTDINDFVGDGFLEVAELSLGERVMRYSPDDTVKRAESRLGEKGYNILHNNCEHFVNECVFGKKSCSQLNSVIEKLRAMPVQNVYYLRIPEGEYNIDLITCAERRSYIDACTCKSVKRERFFVWRLLEYALCHAFGCNIDNLSISRDGKGKWISDNYCFSLSHSKSMCAVAVSRKPVGVDIQQYPINDLSGKLPRKIMNKDEAASYDSLDVSRKANELARIWTCKESVFKMHGGLSFIASETDSSGEPTASLCVTSGSELYMISCAGEVPGAFRFFEVTDAEGVYSCNEVKGEVNEGVS